MNTETKHKFTVGKYKTRDGRHYEVLLDARYHGAPFEDNPLVGKLVCSDKLSRHLQNGAFISADKEHPMDLMPPFEITEPGVYETEEGILVSLERRGDAAHPWQQEFGMQVWTSRGVRFGNKKNPGDIVSKYVEPEKVPITMDDIPQGCEFRSKGSKRRLMPCSIDSQGVQLHKSKIGYNALAKDFEMRAPGCEWKNCSKEGEK